jgi:hypothetical protein
MHIAGAHGLLTAVYERYLQDYLHSCPPYRAQHPNGISPGRLLLATQGFPLRQFRVFRYGMNVLSLKQIHIPAYQPGSALLRQAIYEALMPYLIKRATAYTAVLDRYTVYSSGKVPARP